MATRPTARPPLGKDASSLSPPQTRSRANESRSPNRFAGQDLNNESADSNSDVEHLDSSGEYSRDVLDRSIPTNSPEKYPDLTSMQDIGSKSPRISGQSRATRRHARTHEGQTCSPRDHKHYCAGNSSTVRKVPLTPEKGSPGRKLYPDLEPFKEKRSSPVPPIMYVLFAALIIFCIVTSYHSLKSLEETPKPVPYVKPIEEVFRDIKKELKTMKAQLSQNKELWIQLLGQLATIMVTNPIQPAIILAVVPRGAERTAVCLSHKVGQAVSDGFDDTKYVVYDTKSEVHKGVKHLKKDLFESLLGLEDAHAAIVHNIEEVPGEAAMTFHAFCDNENAPFKQTIIFLLISLPAKYEDLSWRRLESTIDDHLKGIWGEQLLEKDVSAVVSRVANAPILVKPESSDTLEVFCQNL